MEIHLGAYGGRCNVLRVHTSCRVVCPSACDRSLRSRRLYQGRANSVRKTGGCRAALGFRRADLSVSERLFQQHFVGEALVESRGSVLRKSSQWTYRMRKPDRRFDCAPRPFGFRSGSVSHVRLDGRNRRGGDRRFRFADGLHRVRIHPTRHRVSGSGSKGFGAERGYRIRDRMRRDQLSAVRPDPALAGTRSGWNDSMREGS